MPTTNLTPNGAGNYTNWNIGAGCTSNYQCVDDPPGSPDDDTTRLQLAASTNNTRDSYQLTDYGAGGTINSIKVIARIRKNVAGSNNATARLFLRISSTDYDGDTLHNISPDGAYANYEQTWTTNPNTSAAWTDADLDALEAGLLLVAAGDAQVRFTQIYTEVDYTLSSGVATKFHHYMHH